MIEIERKFLVEKVDFKALSSAFFTIKQGYLCADAERTVRVRIKNKKGFLTIKGASSADGLQRMEWERELPLSEAEALFALCLPGAIEKTRYEIPFEGFLYEVDVFEGANQGLVLAEVELKTVDALPVLPYWIREEVTGDERYYNAYLNNRPFKTW